MIADSAEATLFSVGVRVAEQHTMLLRALEARVQQYSDFVTLCTNALNNIQNNIQQAQTYTNQLTNNLLQDRQNVAFTSALLSDETQRVQSVNTQRQQVLATSVQLVAYTRARTLEATDTAPSRQLVPANVTNPVPACLQQSVSIPPEIREIVGQLREAPVNWLPSVSSQVANLERPILLQQLAFSAQARAAQLLQLPLLPSSAAGESGVYASAISSVYSANQQVFRGFQMQRAAFQPAALMNLSWSSQVASRAKLRGGQRPHLRRIRAHRDQQCRCPARSADLQRRHLSLHAGQHCSAHRPSRLGRIPARRRPLRTVTEPRNPAKLESALLTPTASRCRCWSTGSSCRSITLTQQPWPS